ncbi:50S ribosomal protein L11 methyltransferase [Algiphilus sp.]|uniref:50S ribosomal protein L11 methyltransferase n=1 Tax=Algiphilus sp. TaxID=1872431 RepID=UPI003B522BD4
MAWRQLVLQTQYPDFGEEILEAQGALAVSMKPTEDVDPILEPGPGATPLWPRVCLEGLFPDDSDLAPVYRALEELLPDAAQMRAEEMLVPDTDWVRNCLDNMGSMRFGQRLWVAPHHREVDAPGAVVIKLDPGLAFGTGTHPTTDLCLQWLDGASLQGQRVLDFGCGSGILAVAALRLGAREAVAVDNDAQAIVATRENAVNNDVDAMLHCMLDTEFDGDGDFDIVLANILAEPLIALAPTLLAQLKPGGSVVLAGLLDRQAERVEAAYPGIAWTRESLEGWTRLAGRSMTSQH